MTEPRIFAAYLYSDGSPILIKEGEIGYWPWGDPYDVRTFNVLRGYTPQDVAAALAGSMFGWDVPGARPERYTLEQAEHIAYGKHEEEWRAEQAAARGVVDLPWPHHLAGEEA